MKLKYRLTKAAVDQLFVKGLNYARDRVVEFNLEDVTEEARRAWLELYGTTSDVELHSYRIRRGTIYDDGSVDSDEPIVDWLNDDWLKQDSVLTPQDVSEVLIEALNQRRSVESQLAEYKPKWAEALKAYKQKQAAQQAEREAVEKAKEMMQPTIEKLKERISELEGYLSRLIRHASDQALIAAGLVQPYEAEEEEELSQEAQEALRTAGLDDC